MNRILVIERTERPLFLQNHAGGTGTELFTGTGRVSVGESCHLILLANFTLASRHVPHPDCVPGFLGSLIPCHRQRTTNLIL